MLIQMDFSKVNRAVAEYLRGEIKKKAINRDGLLALLNAFEGIQFPGEMTAITEKTDVNYEEIKEKMYSQNNSLSEAIARLEFWFSINRTIGNELSDEESIKNKAATILAHCLQ